MVVILVPPWSWEVIVVLCILRFQVLEIIHQGRPGVPKKEVKAALAKQFKIQDPNQVFVFGVQLQFGGGRSSAFATIYDNMTAAKKFEPKYRQVRVRYFIFFF